MQNDRKRLIELIVNAPKIPILINGIASGKVYQTAEHIADHLIASGLGFVVTDRERLSPYPDGDTSIEACPICGSGEYLHNEDGNRNGYCGQCGQAIDWSEDDV
ncbi:MAG: hypothetical protein IJB57_10900 [Clostridia bacterium]|nr:hypothetical protein [Clostridia bacterium]